MIFFDWLSIYQDFEPGTLPVRGSDHRFTYDLSTGDLKHSLVMGYQHEGSFDTSVRIRSDGTRVEVSGNPSAFGRFDNVQGYSNILDCIDLYNRLLDSVGLPHFQEDDACHVTQLVDMDGDAVVLGSKNVSRPVITAVHLTENFRTHDVLATLRHLSGYFHQGKPGHLYPNGRTVDWGGSNGKKGTGSKRVYVKYYCKKTDLESRLREIKLLSNRSQREDVVEASKGVYQYDENGELSLKHEFFISEDNREIQEGIDYLQKLIEWANSEQIIRIEVSLKSRQLRRWLLQRPGAWNYQIMEEIMNIYAFHKKLNTETVEINNVSDWVSNGGVASRLIAYGVGEAEANRADTAYRAWINGKDLHYKNGVMAKNTFYRLRKNLLLVGVDIANPCNVQCLPMKIVNHKIEVATLPEFYRHVA